MHCQSCGLPISPTTQVCPRCGLRIVPDSQPRQSASPRGSSPSTEQFPWQSNDSPATDQQSFPTSGHPYLQSPASSLPPWHNTQQAPIQNMPSGAFNPGQVAYSESIQMQARPETNGFPPGRMQGGYPQISNVPPTTSGLAYPHTVDNPIYPQGPGQQQGHAQMMASAQPGPVQQQAFPDNSFSSMPMQSGPIQPQMFNSGPFPPAPLQSGPVQSQPLAGPSFPSAPLQSEPILPQALNSGVFPLNTMQSSPAQPPTFNSGPFPSNTMQSSPVQPPILNSGVFPPNTMQSGPTQPPAFNSGPFSYGVGNGPVAFQPPMGYMQQHSPAGVLRSASVIQPTRTSSMRRVLIAVGAGFIVALLVAVGYLAFLQKPATTQITTPVKPILQTHPKKLPPLPSITATDPQALYTQATGREAISNDPLTMQSDNNWAAVNSPGSCGFDGNTLHAVNSSADIRTTMCIASATKYKNVAFQAQITPIKGDTYGLVVRADSKGRLLYLFSVTSTGMYTLAVTDGQNGTLAHVLTGGTSAAIKQGQNQSNQLTIIARDSTLYLYVNQKFLTKVNDTTATSGSVGLFVGNSQGDVSEARFTNAKIWSV